MRRVLLVALLTVFAPRSALADDESQTVRPAAVQSYTFINGVEGYYGCLFRGIGSDSAGVTFGNASPDPADTTIVVGRVGSAKRRAILKWDLSDLPANFVVTEAKCYLFVVGKGASVGPTKQIQIPAYRLFAVTDSLVSWTNATGIGTPATWLVSGAEDSVSSFANIFGSSETLTAGSKYGFKDLGVDYSRYINRGILAVGSDSAYGTSIGADRQAFPAAMTSARTGVGATMLGYLPFDMTECVAKWHNGMWVNRGVILLEPSGLAGANDWSLSFGNAGKKPVLVVYGVEASTTRSGRPTTPVGMQ
jgi:hypothetical protein